MSIVTQPISVTRSTKMVWTGRVISTLCTLFFLFDGVMKLVQPPSVVEGSDRVGVPVEAISGLGIVLLVSVILYATPMTAGLGAILLTGYLGGAVFAHVHVGDPAWMVVMPPILGALVWLGLVLRDAGLRAIIPIRW